jgi:hypothetical protein
MVTLQRQPDNPYDTHIPLVSAMTFGSSSGGLENRHQYQEETLDWLLENGSMSQEQYDQVTAEMEGWYATELKLKLFRNVTFIPGKYDLHGLLFYKGLLTIPEEKRKKGPFWNRKTITLPAQNFTIWLQGGVDLQGANGVTFSEADVYSGKTLVIYMLEQPLPLTWKQLEKQYKPIEEYQRGKEQYAMPKFEEIS